MRGGVCLTSCSSLPLPLPLPPPPSAAAAAIAISSSSSRSRLLSLSSITSRLPSPPSRTIITLCLRSPHTEDEAASNENIMLHQDDSPTHYSSFTSSETTLLHPTSKFLTLPTVLTLARVAAIPFLLCAFYSNEWWATPAVPIIFVLAAVTDWLDGFLARKMGSDSTFGAFLDPVADKLMVATTLVLLCTKPLSVSWAAAFPWLIPLPSTAIIGREITMSAVREWAASQGGELQAAVAVNSLGKWKTASQLVALTALLATRNVSSEIAIAHLVAGFGIALLYISAGLALLSLAAYMKAVWGSLIK